MTSHYYILIADDNPTVRRLLIRVLQTLAPHAHPIEADDGTAALSALRHYQFALVITDYQMPGATGLDVINAVRAQSASLPVLMISARADVEVAARQAGVTEFLVKPFSAQSLTAVLQRLLP